MTDNIKPRLYFTCAIKALYMMKEFGAVCDLDNLDTNKHTALVPLSELMALEKIYIAPESEEIFLPKEGDRIISNEMIGRIQLFGIQTLNINFGSCDCFLRDWEHKILIIMRDNKQFFDCEREND